MINEIQIQQVQGLSAFERKMNKLFKEVDEERERSYRPYWKVKGAYETLSRNIKMTEEHDRKWEDFLISCPYWSDWNGTIKRFVKVSDLSYYCLRLSEVIKYKDKVSNYGLIRNRKTFEKVDRFAWRLMNMKREEFHNEFGGFYDKRIENYIINPDGTYSNILFSDNVVSNDKNDSILLITELGDDESTVQGDNGSLDNENPLVNLTSKEDSMSESKKNDDKGVVGLIDEGNNSRRSTWRDKLPRINLCLPFIWVKKAKNWWNKTLQRWNIT